MSFCKNCISRPCFVDETTGRKHDFCGRFCSIEYYKLCSDCRLHFDYYGSLTDNVCKSDICYEFRHCRCGKLKYCEDNGKIHQYCSRSCSKK